MHKCQMLLEVNVRCCFSDFLSMSLIYKGICLCNVKCVSLRKASVVQV